MEELAAIVAGATVDGARLVKAGLENHDPETTLVGFARVSRVVGQEMATEFLTGHITKLMDKGWSFVNEETGEASPLI